MAKRNMIIRPSDRSLPAEQHRYDIRILLTIRTCRQVDDPNDSGEGPGNERLPISHRVLVRSSKLLRRLLKGNLAVFRSVNAIRVSIASERVSYFGIKRCSLS